MQIDTGIYSNCERCGKQIPSHNATIHLLICARNNVKCNVCDKYIDKIDLPDHDKIHVIKDCECGKSMTQLEYETHRKTCFKVNCKYCKEQFINTIAPAHEEICDMRIIKCLYCDIELTKNFLPEHINSCGARTEKCPLCMKFVMIKDTTKHICFQCNKCGKVFNNEPLFKFHSNSCMQNTSQKKMCLVCDKFTTKDHKCYKCACGDIFDDELLYEYHSKNLCESHKCLCENKLNIIHETKNQSVETDTKRPRNESIELINSTASMSIDSSDDKMSENEEFPDLECDICGKKYKFDGDGLILFQSHIAICENENK